MQGFGGLSPLCALSLGTPATSGAAMPVLMRPTPPQSPRHGTAAGGHSGVPQATLGGSLEASSVPRGGCSPRLLIWGALPAPPLQDPCSWALGLPTRWFAPLFRWTASSSSYSGRVQMFESSTVKLLECLYLASTLVWYFSEWKFSVENPFLSGLVRHCCIASNL